MGLERRGRADQGQSGANPSGEEPRVGPRPKVKPLGIGKRLVFEAWEKVRTNKRQGCAGRGCGQHRAVRAAVAGQPLPAVEQPYTTSVDVNLSVRRAALSGECPALLGCAYQTFPGRWGGFGWRDD
jgi:hypothetical protein